MLKYIFINLYTLGCMNVQRWYISWARRNDTSPFSLYSVFFDGCEYRNIPPPPMAVPHYCNLYVKNEYFCISYRKFFTYFFNNFAASDLNFHLLMWTLKLRKCI